MGKFFGSACGALSETKNCTGTPRCAIDGNWSPFSNWTQCTASCGGYGKQQRNRTCNAPPKQFGGKDCNGTAIEEQKCNEQDCPFECDEAGRTIGDMSTSCEAYFNADGRFVKNDWCDPSISPILSGLSVPFFMGNSVASSWYQKRSVAIFCAETCKKHNKLNICYLS